jgi:hypothetical protein
MEDAVHSMLQGMPASERALYTTVKLAEILGEFERLSAQWSILKVGESFTESW